MIQVKKCTVFVGKENKLFMEPPENGGCSRVYLWYPNFFPEWSLCIVSHRGILQQKLA